MERKKLKYFLLMMTALSISNKVFSQDTVYELMPYMMHAVSQPNKAIAIKKIKTADEYYVWDSIYKNDTCYLFNRKQYDNKGRVIEQITYSQDYGDYISEYSLKSNWLNDTTVKVRIVYNKG